MYEKVKKDKTADEALASLMRLCARAERSTGDARRLLFRWGVPQAEHDRVVARLVEGCFIDDGRYAEAYVREKINLSGWGLRKIKAALAAKGISRAVIERATASLDRVAVEERLEAVLVRKARTVKARDVYDRKNKLVRYGLSLGYDYEPVLQAVEKIMDNDNEQD